MAAMSFDRHLKVNDRRNGPGFSVAAKRAGGSIKDVVTITVNLVDPRLIDPLMPIRREVWPDGDFPTTSTSTTVHNLPAVGMMLEISAVAVIGDR